jgi:hypothetical protein
MSRIHSSSHRSYALPVVVAASVALAAGWAVGTGLARMFRARTPSARAGRPFPAEAPRTLTEADLDQEEVVRAMLDSDHERFDELGRPVRFPVGASSRRYQGAAPLDLTNVEE